MINPFYLHNSIWKVTCFHSANWNCTTNHYPSELQYVDIDNNRYIAKLMARAGIFSFHMIKIFTIVRSLAFVRVLSIVCEQANCLRVILLVGIADQTYSWFQTISLDWLVSIFTCARRTYEYREKTIEYEQSFWKNWFVRTDSNILIWISGLYRSQSTT